jgi:hypothetical protein
MILDDCESQVAGSEDCVGALFNIIMVADNKSRGRMLAKLHSKLFRQTEQHRRSKRAKVSTRASKGRDFQLSKRPSSERAASHLLDITRTSRYGNSRGATTILATSR